MIRKIVASKWLQFFLLMGFTVSFAFLVGSENPLQQNLQWFAFDKFNYLDSRPAQEVGIIVDIDEHSLAQVGQWPWPRDVLADLVTNLEKLGVRVIVFDMVFPESDRASPHNMVDKAAAFGLSPSIGDLSLPNNDLIFAKAIKEAGNVVMGFIGADLGDTIRLPVIKKPVRIKENEKKIIIPDLAKIVGITTNLPVLEKAAAGNGIFLATPEQDGIIRQIPLIARYPIILKENNASEKLLYPTLALETLRVGYYPKANYNLGRINGEDIGLNIPEGAVQPHENYIRMGASDRYIPVNSAGKMFLKFRKMTENDYISAAQILDESYHGAIKNKLEGKVAFIGTSAEGLKDIRSTPLDKFIPGVEVHLNLYEQLVSEDYVYRGSEQNEWLFVLICGSILALLSVFSGVLFLSVFTIISLSGAILGSFYLYKYEGLLVDPAFPSISIFLIFVMATIFNYIRSESSRREIRSAFGLYISPDFMKELTDNPDKLTLGGEIRDLTVMFTDIRNFTTISESMTPEALINTMNDFLTPMSDAVMKTRGTIDKYMGDAMMAFWNAPLDDSNHPRHAIEAALAMKKALEPVNASLKLQAEKEGRKPLLLAAGIGINTGPCAVGNMGSRQRFAYSALGDAVNLASRLESQTKTYKLDLLVGEETIKQIDDFAWVEIDLIQVKGKTQPVRIYTVLGPPMMGQREVFLKFRDTHMKFLEAYRVQDFKMAREWINDCQNNEFGKPLSGYYTVMLQRIGEFQTNKPPQNWDGVYVALSK